MSINDSHLPNIVLVMTDQQRQGFTAGEGFGLDTMPYCDRLAGEGRRFRHGFTPAPACVPARTSLLTGRFPTTHRVRQNSTNGQAVRGDDLLDVLRATGYQTMFAGKPHMYRQEADFDSWAGPYMHTGAPPGTEQEQAFTDWLVSIDHGPATEPTPYPVEVQYPVRIVDDAMGQLRHRDPDRPMFSWVSFPEPHNPYQAPEPYWSLFDPEGVPDRLIGPEGAAIKGGDFAWLRTLVEEKRPGYDEMWRRYRATYCGMMRLIDDQVARLHEAIQHELGDNTMIIYISDHGDYVGDYGLQRKGAGMPDALMRVPFWIAGAGVEPIMDDTSMVSLVDLLPTVCELVGSPIPLGVQGRSLAPLLRGEDGPEARSAFSTVYAESGFGGAARGVDERPELHFDYHGTGYDELNTVTQSGSTRMVHDGRWKLLFFSDGRAELYDTVDDPAELHDLAGAPECRERLLGLQGDLLWWMTNLGDDLPGGAYRTRRPRHNWMSLERT